MSPGVGGEEVEGERWYTEKGRGAEGEDSGKEGGEGGKLRKYRKSYEPSWWGWGVVR